MQWRVAVCAGGLSGHGNPASLSEATDAPASMTRGRKLSPSVHSARVDCTLNAVTDYQNMKIIHFALIAGLSTGLALSAGAQQPDTTTTAPASTAPNTSAPTTGTSPSPSKSSNHRARRHTRHKRHRRDANGMTAKARRQERGSNGTVQKQPSEQRTNGDQTQSREQSRGQQTNDSTTPEASPQPSPQ